MTAYVGSPAQLRDLELARVHDENQRLRVRIAELESLPILPGVAVILEHDIDEPSDHETSVCLICHADTTESGLDLCDKHDDRAEETADEL